MTLPTEEDAALATNADIAKAAGVSPAIVSRIVNNDKKLRVSAETRARVLSIIAELDYTPNIAARTLKSAKSGIIALVVHDLTSSVYSEIIAGAYVAAHAHGKTVMVGEAGALAQGQSHLGTWIAGGGVDAVILQGAGTDIDRTLTRAARAKVPTVLLQTGNPTASTVVKLDDYAAGRSATQHLLDLGHRAIGFLSVDDARLFSLGRQKGWVSALQDADIAPTDEWVSEGGNSFATGAEGIEALLAKAPETKAVVVASIVAAIGVLSKLGELGKRVPDDISLIAIHDILLANYLSPPLTVVKMPLRELGIKAVELVCADEAPAPALITLKAAAPEVIVRSSTRAAET